MIDPSIPLAKVLVDPTWSFQYSSTQLCPLVIMHVHLVPNALWKVRLDLVHPHQQLMAFGVLYFLHLLMSKCGLNMHMRLKTGECTKLGDILDAMVE